MQSPENEDRAVRQRWYGAQIKRVQDSAIRRGDNGTAPQTVDPAERLRACCGAMRAARARVRGGIVETAGRHVVECVPVLLPRT